MSYRVARCSTCGFHYADLLPPDAQFDVYYETLSKYDTVQNISALDQQRNDAAVQLCARANIPKTARIVDLGCGFGAFLAALRDAGWAQVTGVDPGPQSPATARTMFGLNDVRTGTLANAGACVDLSQAGLVCLMAVLEHLPQLPRDLSRLLAAMRPGSRLLIEVPALDAFEGDAGEPFGELSLEHIQFFSAVSMRNLLARLGARVLLEEVVPLPIVNSGSLFVVAEVGAPPSTTLERESGAIFDAYLRGSAVRLRRALTHVPDVPFLLYGAGAHSARLIHALSQEQQSRIVTVLDGNPNLHGKRFGRWTIKPPEALSEHPELPVLISSFRSEKVIANALGKRFSNPLILMYSQPEA